MKYPICKFAFVLLFIIPVQLKSQNVQILDKKHYSNVLGEIRNFRVFLPPGYEQNKEKRYPVIYYYHGWSQRYFGSTSHSSTGIDKGTDNDGDNLANFVKTHDVIVVKPDGYNRSPDESYDLRPYNVSPVETYRQFPLYFPELVKYIDENYRTIPDREHRAISGLSMGGFMTFWVAGKYPDLVCAAGNFCGSTEFFVGPKKSPVEYRHLDMYENYDGVNVRLNYGDKDFIRCYHNDVNKIWTQVMDNYEYHIYDAAHSTCGLTEMYDYILKTFENPPAKPERWNHVDAYPGFSVWGYEINSNRDLPGFTKLENVDKNGFRIAVRELLPDGELLPYVNLSIITAPVYKANEEYLINDIDLWKGDIKQSTIKSDSNGRLKIDLNGSLHEIGITKKGESPNLCIASFEIVNMPWATTNKDIEVSVRLLNKGGSVAEGIKAEIKGFRGTTNVIQGKSEFGKIGANETIQSKVPFVFKVNSDSIEIVKLILAIKDQDGNNWEESFEIPLMTDQPDLNNFVIADGKEFTVVDAGIDSITTVLGKGNGDSIANPGESIIVLIKDGSKLWRTFLYTSDKYINPFGMNNRQSDNWGRHDHVGASEKYSVPLIASDCPENQTIEFFAEYWLPDYPDHIIKRGKVRIHVSDDDKTSPILKWVRVSGDNTIQTKLADGTKITDVKAVVEYSDTLNNYYGANPGFQNKLNLTLYDNGEEGDKVAGDNVFSFKIPEQKFGIYSVKIEASDLFGNQLKESWKETIVLY